LSWEVLQTRRFARTYKKLKPEIVRHVDQAVEKIQADPEIGQQKKGDLARLRVYKFHAANQLFLLGYTLEESPRLIYLQAVEPHENFYQRVKR